MKTPQQTYPELNKALGMDVFLKREDLHKYKSHKGRSIPLMVKKYAKDGATRFVISSSGNAGLAAGLAVENHNRNNPDKQVSLRILVGTHVDPQKLVTLQNSFTDQNILITQTERPKQEAFQLHQNGEAVFLRQSTDDTALEGYLALADELTKIPDLQAVFIPTSSGTTAQALGQQFEALGQHIQIHIVQTTACHPIAGEFDDAGAQTPSTAGAIVDRIAHRKIQVSEIIKKTNGSGWVVHDEAIEKARELIKKTTKIEISTNSALSVAGLQKAIKQNWTWNGPVVCLITGM